jgi:hypothetical protein
MGSVKIVKKIVLGVFSEVRKYLSRSFPVVTEGVFRPGRLDPILFSRIRGVRQS